MGWESRLNQSAEYAVLQGYRKPSKRRVLLWSRKHLVAFVNGWLDEGKRIRQRKALRRLAA